MRYLVIFLSSTDVAICSRTRRALGDASIRLLCQKNCARFPSASGLRLGNACRHAAQLAPWYVFSHSFAPIKPQLIHFIRGASFTSRI